MINVELSSIWSCVSLPQLLACEKDLFDAHLHLRSNQPGAPEFLGWLGQPDAVTAKTIHAIRKACETISGQCDTLVVAGSGEGYLAAKAGVEMLGGRPESARQPDADCIYRRLAGKFGLDCALQAFRGA